MSGWMGKRVIKGLVKVDRWLNGFMDGWVVPSRCLDRWMDDICPGGWGTLSSSS